jgi:hypothetical protein
MTHEAGKGSRPRPFSVAQDEYERRWDAIFSRDLDKEKTNEDGEVLHGNVIDRNEKVEED